ncbi:MAG: patatin-like phospholipase family protein [Acidobacteriota bacterium]
MTLRKSEDPLTLGQVLSDELKHLKNVDIAPDEELKNILTKLHEHKLTALCFSGGGIRSATFGLGIVQALAKNKLLTHFDYLSTVSGGGYLGSWLSAWIYRATEVDKKTGKKVRLNSEKDIGELDLGVHRIQGIINCTPMNGVNKPNPEPTQLQHLREYSNYMSPKTGLFSTDGWTLAAIYLRNQLLNLLIFIPLMAAVLMVPRILFRSVGQPDPGRTIQFALLFLAMVLGSWAISFVIGRLPSKISKSKEQGIADEGAGFWKKVIAFSNTDAGVLAFGVLPLMLAAFITSTLWIWVHKGLSQMNNIQLESYRVDFANFHPLVFVMAAVGTAFLMGVLIFRAVHRSQKVGWWAGTAAFFSSILGGILLWFTTEKIFPCVAGFASSWFGSQFIWPLYLCFAVPTFLIIVLISATIFVGLTSRTMTDEDREWLARFGALVLSICGAWVGVNALVLLGPMALEWTFNLSPESNFEPSFTNLSVVLSTVAAVVSAVLSLGGGFSGKSKVRTEGAKTPMTKFLAIAPRLGAVVLLVMIFVVIAYVTSLLLHVLWIGGAGIESHLGVLSEVRFNFISAALLGLTVIGLFMACFVSVNKFSLHGAYRDRLVRAYLGASNKDRKQNTFTGFDDNDNLELHELGSQRPLHVINATVNLVGGKNLAWQDRKAASFTMSPLHCGSWAVKGYRRTRDYCRNTTSGKALRLGTAMAISGAAANPNMGYYSSSVVTFLMSLCNVRLGWWLGNTGKPGSDYDWFGRGKSRFFEKVGPSIAVLPLVNETLGRTDETKRFLMVTDGGHFENLALYEMVLRRCRFILLSDGAADATFKFGEIANAIQKCKVDLGVEIQFVGSMNIRARTKEQENETSKIEKSRFAIARITYPETYLKEKTNKETGEVTKEFVNYVGWLLYTRPTYYRSEPRDIMHYADSHEEFPHQSTADQMYDEKQFEAYRGLGFLTMSEIRNIFDATALGDPHDEVDDDLERLFARDPEMRKTIFGFFGVGDPVSYTPRKS